MVTTQIKDEDIKNRIREVIKAHGGNASKLARKMSVNPAYFASLINSPEKGISATVFKALLKMNVDVNWLITGDGNMSLGDETGGSWKERALTAEKHILENNTHIDNLNFLIKNLERMIQDK